ncbi:MAG: pyridoxamine 5'-phosphate oxidase family protein [Microbacterium sp.]|jgi:nitroimidazol reductase NimA-like FMN-containing flavoprotein (pyridoxamine 5'-phosphate oxidase superfamily)|uniref:pyridoxamine 5'-phosphate oxidase family protein n=1 Tax=Microbacterium sp. TaxID=51671 RepID=UPI002829B357|nr:pyridoxamine 5'-phosphate oxidase family protein [Microbacterium sp.]MDR2323447.1 pyridoxamine 5'-phosphate oxidase family protein [Microbacterium sp.]
MIIELSEQECYDLLTATTVGRIGFVHDARVLILPVNFVVSGRDLLLRTTAEGLLGALSEVPVEVAFEVDGHVPLSRTAWSVLMHGPLSRVPEEEAGAVLPRVSPWAGGERDLPLRFRIESMTGRTVHGDQAP